MAFIAFSLLMGYWSFIYDLYMTGIAGKVKLLFPDTGLKIFSQSMLINTVICASFAIVASNFFKDSFKTIMIAMVLMFGGFSVAALRTESSTFIYLGAFLITLGELAYGAVGQFTLVRLVPDEARSGTNYAIGMTLVNVCRLIGSAIAFPLIVYGKNPLNWAIPIFILTLLLILLSVIFRKDFRLV